MHLTLSADDLAFRERVRERIAAVYTDDLRAAAARQSGVIAEPQMARRWQKVLHQERWIALGWPTEYGGPDYTAVERYIIESELAAAGAPNFASMGVQMCGPVLIGFGTPEQKAYFLPKILSGEHYCARAIPNPAPARTSPRCRPGRCATATTM